MKDPATPTDTRPASIAGRIGAWFSTPPVQAVAAEQAALRSDRFRLEREMVRTRQTTTGELPCA